MLDDECFFKIFGRQIPAFRSRFLSLRGTKQSIDGIASCLAMTKELHYNLGRGWEHRTNFQII